MEFFEFILVISLTVLLPLTILKTVLEYKKSQSEAERRAGESSGLTIGELKKMLSDVVQEANAPLVERIEDLERARGDLPAPGLFAGVGEDVTDDEMMEEEAGKTLGRRVRN
jgi:hypothetical protein